MAASGTLYEERRLGVLDGMRGIAVLLVLWYHVWEISWLRVPSQLEFIPETGFVGVHLFFFLSGFVIAYPFVRSSLLGTPQPAWGHFAWRRFTKIVPSYWLSIAVAYAIGYAQAQPFASTIPDLLSHAFFVHTWFPQRYGTINGVLWTLAVEVEFYCIFPAVWWCFKRRPWLTVLGMILAAWAWRAMLAHCCMSTLFAQYEENLPGYLDIFAFGMIGAYTFTRYGERIRTANLRGLAPALGIAGVALLVILMQGLFAYRLAPQWAGVWQIDRRPLFGLAFAAIALGFLTSPRAWQLLLDNPPLRFFAAISYNLYLYHQLIARELLAHHVPAYTGNPHASNAWQIRYTTLAFTVTIAQAALVTYFFERPFLRLRQPRLARARNGALRLAWDDGRSAPRRSPKRR